MKSIKKVLILALALVCALGAVSCNEKTENTGYRYSYAELAFDLPLNYADMKSDSFDALFTNGEAFIGVSRLSFYGVENDDLDGSMFPETVAEKYAQKNSLDVEIEVRESFAYFSYSEGGYFNFMAFYRSKYAHFIVRFTCIDEKSERYEPLFLKYAEEARFTL